MTLVLSRSPWVVRSFRSGDEPSLRLAADDWHVARWLRDAFPHPYTEKEASDWVSYASREVAHTEFAIATATEPQRVVGSVGFRLQEDMHRRSAEVGYWVARSHWRRGVATHALAVTVQHAFDHFPVDRLFAGVKDGNRGSVRVLERLGFQLEGRSRAAVTGREGETKDELLFGLLRHEWAGVDA
ncbi:MAG: GNAT family protein [Acidobacteriota bacterium]